MVDLPSLIKNFINVELKSYNKNTYPGKKSLNEIYEQMYVTADRIAVHETKRYSNLQHFKDLYGHVIRFEEMKDADMLSENVGKYRNERVQYHMGEMKKLFEQILDAQKELLKNKS